MNAERGKQVFTLLAYVYWPAAYFGIYLPFIIPRLDQWRQIPIWIPIVLALGFIFALVNLGMRSSTKTNLIHAISIWASMLLFMFLMAKFVMPGFKKSTIGHAETSAWFTVEDLIVIVLPILLFFAVAEGGRILLTKKARL